MAETDILNPVTGWSEDLGFNPNWSYGWVRKTASNRKPVQPRLGRRYSRLLQNAGYSASLNFIDIPWAQVLYIKRFYEQFQNGYFTLINWDGGGRHHVGNFTTEPNEVQTANGKWTIQGLVFEEAAQARMLNYPSDFTCSSHNIYAVDDYLTPLVATYTSLAVSVAHPGWNAEGVPNATAPIGPSQYEMFIRACASGDYAQAEYVGWGFRMKFRTSTDLSQCGIYLDGTLLLTIDQSTGGIVGSGSLPAGVTYANGVLTALQVPLDAHRVKIVSNGVAGTAGTFNLVYPSLEVLH